MLSVAGLQEHEALVALEVLSYVLDEGSNLFLLVTGDLLYLVGSVVEREDEEVDRQREQYQGERLVAGHLEYQREQYLEDKFDRVDKKIVKIHPDVHTDTSAAASVFFSASSGMSFLPSSSYLSAR